MDTRAVVGALLLLVAGVATGAAPAAGQETGASSAVTAPGAAAGQSTAAIQGSCSFPVTETDATGTEVTVEEEPEEVVVLAPSAAQTMWEIGAAEKVTGMPVNQYTAYLNGSENRTNVVNQDGQPIREEVIGLEPDLVLAPNIIDNETVQQLRDSGLTVYKYEEAATLEDVANKTRTTGRLVGHYEQAARVSADMEATVEAVRTAVADEERPRVYFELGGGYTAAPGSFIHEIIVAAGGENIAAGESDRPYPELSQEVIAQKDPQWIVLNGEFAQVPNTDVFNESTAVQEGNVVRVNANYISQPGPRNVQPLTKLAETFHPEAYESADVENATATDVEGCAARNSTATGTPTPTATDAAVTTDDDTATPTETATETATPHADDGITTTPTETTASGSGPGFTAMTAALAMLAAALLARRR